MDNLCDQAWRASPPSPVLDDDAVHVWRAALTGTPERVAALSRTLGAEERQRAEGFRFERDGMRYIVAHGVLRALLARYCGGEPGALAFRANAFGKPALVDAPGRARIRFNLSHAGDVALYALTVGREVGVDIEQIRAEMAGERIAERFFSAREVAMLRALDAPLQQEAFFTCWTRKEAYKKARGEGIGVGLDRFDVSLAPGEPAALLASREGDAAPGCWSLRHLAPSPGYVGAVAVQGEGARLTCWQWQEAGDCGWRGGKMDGLSCSGVPWVTST